MIHIRNGRADRHAHTRGSGLTWCGKKLLGQPAASSDAGVDMFVSYGSEVHVSIDPAAGTCERCRAAFDAEFNASFPEGLKPIASFRLDNPDDMAKARQLLSPEALARRASPLAEGAVSFADVIERTLREATGDA